MRLDLLGSGGVFSAADAATHGLDGHALRRLVRSGTCLRLTRGWYAVSTAVPSTPEGRHALTATALARAAAGRAVVSHHSALVLHDLPVHAVDLDTVHLTALCDPSGGRVPNPSARRRGLVVHRPVRGLVRPTPSPRSTAAPTTATVPLAWAVVQAGLVHGPEAALVPADAALARGVLDTGQLERAVHRLAGHPGLATVRAALRHVEGRHESPGETRTAYVLRSLGFELEPQVVLTAEGRTYRADFRIRGTRVLVEFDGALKYADPRALFEEKRREDALRREGWAFVRVVWADLADAQRLGRLVRRAMLQAAS